VNVDILISGNANLDRGPRIPIHDRICDESVGTVPSASARDVEHALTAALPFVLFVRSGPEWSRSTRHLRGALTRVPYEGLARKGLGNEGPRRATQELAELKTVVPHPPSRESE
jgi:hypothetical protein